MSVHAHVRSLYWRVFNFLVRRVIATGFCVVGWWMAFANLHMLMPGGTVVINGVRTDDLVLRAFAVGFPLVVAILGIALFRAKPYVPGASGKE